MIYNLTEWSICYDISQAPKCILIYPKKNFDHHKTMNFLLQIKFDELNIASAKVLNKGDRGGSAQHESMSKILKARPQFLP